MKNIIKLEVNKALKNRLFFISVILGCIITILSLQYNINVYHNNLATLKDMALSSPEGYKVLTPAYTVFNNWIGGEPFSLGTAIFFFVFPLLIALPYGWSYCEERRNGYSRSMIVQSGKTPYFISKYIAVFLSGGLAMAIPLIFNFLLAALIFPSITPVVTYDTVYGVFGGSLMSNFYYTRPFLYVVIYICIDFVYSGLLACISLAVTAFLKQKWVVVIIPFFVCLMITFAERFVYISSETIYKRISPLYFLRPVESGYAASWTIIIVSAVMIFLTTFLIHMIWERKHEVY